MANTEFSKNNTQPEVYKTFKFLIKYDGKYVAGITKVSGLKIIPALAEHFPGYAPDATFFAPGQDDYEAITLERGVTYDEEFEQWANKLCDYSNTTKSDDNSRQNISLKDFRKNITIELYNEAGQKVTAYNVFNCWVSEFIAFQERDSNGKSVVIQSMTLQNEGWKRESDVKAPVEPEYTLPGT